MIGIGLAAGKMTIERPTPWGMEHCWTGETAEEFLRSVAGRRISNWGDCMSLSSALGVMGRNDEAILWAKRALGLAYNSSTLFNLAFAYETVGEFDVSFELVEQAIRLDASNYFAGLLYAEGLLRRGNWREGWPLYERYCWGDAWDELRDWRPEWRGQDTVRLRSWPDFARHPRAESRGPSPSGVEGIAGKRILILPPAQGCGDLIMFLRWCGELKKCGAYVIYTCSAMMETLFQDHEWIDRLVVIGNTAKSAETIILLEEFDCWACLMSLPWAFGSTPETVPWDGPYIAAKRRVELGNREHGSTSLMARLRSPSPSRVEGTVPEQRRGEGTGNRESVSRRRTGNRGQATTPSPVPYSLFPVPSARKPLVGLCSQAGETNDPRRVRSLSASQTERLLELDSVEWISLDYGRQPLIEDWNDTAALIDALDLVVTVDTGVMHLAGAMGKPTWVILPVRSDAKFFLDRSDSPLYPSLRLFRSTRKGGMSGAVERVAEAICDF